MTGWRGGADKSNAAGGCRGLRAWGCSIGLWSVRRGDGRWQLAAGWRGRDGVMHDYIGSLADRGYSPQTVRAYAFDLLAFARWLAAERLAMGEVSADVVLRYLAYCRRGLLPGRAGGNVYSIRDGRNVGYAPATINRRLAAVSGLFGYQAMRDPAAPSPIPRRAEARRQLPGSAAGCWPSWPGRNGALA